MAYLTNSQQENFGTVGGNANVTVTHASLIFDYGGDSDGDDDDEVLLWTGRLAVARTFTPGDEIILPAGALDINLPNGDLEDAAVKLAWDQLIAYKVQNPTMLLATASMGSTGKNNEVTANGYSRQGVELSTGTGLAPTA